MSYRRFQAFLTMKLVILLIAYVCMTASARAQNLIQITSPATGAVEYQGSTFEVTFTADPSVSNLILTGEMPGAFSMTQSSANTFSVTVPAATPIEQYQLYVAGTVGGQVIASQPITIKIDTRLTITAFHVDPEFLSFRSVGQADGLLIIATLSDGSTAFVTNSAQLSFSSGNSSIATVDSTGNVTAISPGSTSISIQGPNGLSTAVPVVVPSGAMIVATPTLVPAPGTFAAPQQVVISDVTSGAMLYYTTDGTAPTSASAAYTGPITVSTTETINALAIVPGQGRSIGWGTYTIVAATTTPTFTPPAGSFITAQTVTLSDATAGATIYYTTDGTAPTTSSAVYNSPLSVVTTETLRAIAIASGYAQSPVATATYTINIPVAATPTFTPAADTFNTPQTVTISDATAGAAVYYTTDGTAPTASSSLYSGPITVSSTETIQAIATASGYSNSSVASATYTINLPQDFTLGLSASSLSVAAGQSGTVTASVGPVNGFSQPVSFACSGLPSGVACSFSPATVTPNGTASATTTVTISTSATAGLLGGDRPYELAGLVAGLSLLLAGRRFRKLGRIGVLLLLMIGVGSAVSCGGGSSAPKSTPTTSTVSINATSGSLTHTASLSLTVQ